MVLFYLLILVMPLSDHHIWSQFLGDLTGIKYLGLACVLYAVYHRVVRRSLPSFFGTWQARLFLVLFCLGTVSYFAMPSQLFWYNAHWVTYLSLLMLFFISLSVIDSIERLRWTLLIASASLALASLYAVRDWQINHVLYPGYRPAGVVGDANYFSVDILLFLPVTLLLAQRPRPFWQRWFCLGCFSVTLFALILSSSRGAFLGLLASSFYLVLRLRHRARNLAVITLSLLVVIMFSPNSPIERFRNPSAGDETSADTHVALLHGGIRLILANPVLGVGLDNFMSRIPDYVTREEASRMDRVARVAHNSYVEVGAEVGIPALLVFLGILVSNFISLEKVARRSRRYGAPYLREAALGLETGLIGGSIAMFFISAEYEKLFWMSIFIGMCLPPLMAEAKRKQKRLDRQVDRPLLESSSDSDQLLEPAHS
jgi:O-antigen ligase